MPQRGHQLISKTQLHSILHGRVTQKHGPPPPGSLESGDITSLLMISMAKLLSLVSLNYTSHFLSKHTCIWHTILANIETFITGQPYPDSVSAIVW